RLRSTWIEKEVNFSWNGMLSGMPWIDRMNFWKSSTRYRVLPWASRPVVDNRASAATVEAIKAVSRLWKASKKVSTTFLTAAGASGLPAGPWALRPRAKKRPIKRVVGDFAIFFDDSKR